MSYKNSNRDQYLAQVYEPVEVDEKSDTAPPDPFDDLATGNWESELKALIDMFSMKNLYFNEPWVYLCTNSPANNISSTPMSVWRRTLVDRKIVEEPAMAHPLMPMIEQPNEFEGYSTFMHKVVTEMVLMGNAVIWKLRFHKQLVVIPTEYTSIRFDENNKIDKYLINTSITDEFARAFGGNILEVDPSDIIHIRLPNPNSMLWGLSPFVPGRKTILFDRYSSEYLLNFYLKQANPGPVLEMGKEANERSALRFLKSVENRWTGRQNQRRTMLLPKGITAKNLTQSLAEQELREHIKLNRETIRAILLIPPHELGIQESGSLGSKETEFQLRNYWESSLMPKQKLIADSFTTAFMQGLGEKYFFKFDNSDVPALKVDLQAKAAVATSMLSTLTLNEVRSEVWDAEPLEGGDETPGQTEQQPAFGGFFQAPEPQTKDVTIDATLDAFIGMKKQLERKSAASKERQFLEDVLGIFIKFAPIAIATVTDMLEGVAEKAEGDSPKDIQKELQKLIDALAEEYKNVHKASSAATAEIGYDLQMSVPFNLPDKDAIEALRVQNKQRRLEILEARAIQSFKGVSKTTTKEIMARIRKGLSERQPINQISRNIRTYFEENVVQRAQTIARTEILTAVSLGQKAAADDIAKTIPGVKKMWVTAGDDRVRSFDKGDAADHERLDKDVVEMDEKFANGLGYPREPGGKAAEVINCRCTWLILPPQDGIPDVPDNPKGT